MLVFLFVVTVPFSIVRVRKGETYFGDHYLRMCFAARDCLHTRHESCLPFAYLIVVYCIIRSSFLFFSS